MSNTPNPTPTTGPTSADLGAAIAGAKSLVGGVSSAEISNTEIRKILTGLDDTKRLEVQQILERKGWYGSTKRGNGFLPADLNAFQNFYEVAKSKGLDWQTALTQVRKGPDLVLGSSAVNKVPSPIDLKEVLQRTALTVVGRKLDDKSVDNLVASYQAASNGTATTNAPAADTFFKSHIEQQYGAESDATKYLSAIGTVSRVLGRL